MSAGARRRSPGARRRRDARRRSAPLAAAKAILDRAVGPVFPCYQAVVSRGDEILLRAHGGASAGSGIDDRSVFDLASLTKPLVTASLAMLFVEDGRLPLDGPVSELLPGPVAAGPGVTPRRLLSHAAGLPAWRPFYLEVPASSPDRRAEIFRRARDTAAEAPPGTAALYGDLDFILLTEAIERLGRDRIDRLFARDCPSEGLFFRPLSTATADRRTARFVPTERDPTRGTLTGRVDDENAYAMDGVSGHAGLFGDAESIRRFVSTLLDAWHGRASWIGEETVRTFFARQAEPSGTTWALGWDTPSARGSTAGSRPPAAAVGHTGFTGTSVWIDPPSETVVVLLTNRVWPDRSNESIRRLRPRFHDAVWSALGS